jgi:hypothetical protein
MKDLLAANGFPSLPQDGDDDVTMNGVVYYTSTRG